MRSSRNVLTLSLLSLFAFHTIVHAAIPIPKVDPEPAVPHPVEPDPVAPNPEEGGSPGIGGTNDPPQPGGIGGIIDDPPSGSSGSGSGSGSAADAPAQDPLAVPSSASSSKADAIRELAEKAQDLIDAASSLEDALSGSASATASASGQLTITHSPATATPDPVSACAVFSTFTSACASISPAFPSAPASAQAGCACYSAGYYVPEAFDVAASVCAKAKSCVGSACQVKTAASDQVGLCTREGNVRSAPTASVNQYTAAAGAGNASATTSASSGPVATAPPSDGAGTRMGAWNGGLGLTVVIAVVSVFGGL